MLLIALAGVLPAAGCSRAHYRRQADKEVYGLIDCDTRDPRWPLENYTIQPDSRSRMFDPDNPDCPPMPPDDPVSHKLMHCVDCKKGYPCWHAHGDTDEVENRSFVDYLPRDDQGRIVFDSESAVQTALRNSVQYQNELEDVYLSALDVTFERFRFDVQFFGGAQLFYTADGPLRTGNSSSELELSTFSARDGSRISANKLFATGGELMVGLANSIVWQFSGPDTNTAFTLLDFSLVQPLLRGAGRDFILERLTIAERTLLANVRQMERYRQGFVTSIMTGRDAGQGPSRRGGFFGGSGLEGFSGVGGGGFGRVGGAASGQQQQGDLGAAGGAGAARAGGFLGLLQDQQEIRNLEANVASLRDSLERIQITSTAPNLDTAASVRLRFQLELARQALHNAESRLLIAKNDYRGAVDRFKLAMGLPPDLPVEIKDSLLERFTLINPELTALQGVTDGVLIQLQPTPEPLTTYRANLVRFVEELERYTAALKNVTDAREQATEQFGTVREAVAELDKNAGQRRTLLGQLSQRLYVRENNVAPEVLNVERFNQQQAQLHRQLAAIEAGRADPAAQPQRLAGEFEATLAEARRELAALEGDGAGDINRLVARRQEAFTRATSLVQRLSDDLADMWLIQAKARVESIVLSPIEVDELTAYRVAADNRLDWMNARAGLVDTWRLIQFNANGLESELNVVFSGDMGTIGDNPVKFDAATGRLRVGVQFDAPLTRLAERNSYRQALIEYQQAKRNYYQFVDRVKFGLRNTLRTIEVNQLNFELRRAAVHVALTQVDLARQQLQAPERPAARTAPGQLAQTTTQFGEVGRDLVSALSDLVQVQNDFLSVWLNYRVQQMALDLDLGTMRLDPEGNWIERTSFQFDADGKLCAIDDGDAALDEAPAPPPSPGKLEPVPARPPQTGGDGFRRDEDSVRKGPVDEALPPPPPKMTPARVWSPPSSTIQPPENEALPTKTAESWRTRR
jgi:hypothetical protein